MKALLIDRFGEKPSVVTVPDPEVAPDGVVVAVEASGICRSDWHSWMGHDRDVVLPHVPGHELAGLVVATGKEVRRWRCGDRVTIPFSAGCGSCAQCNAGFHNICDHYFQPGFTHWGSFAQFVSLRYADVNLVSIPPEIDFDTAASLGCRFITSWRAVVTQGELQPGQWFVVHGCGGVGLSAILIAHAMGARVVAVDIDAGKLTFARELGAEMLINALEVDDVIESLIEITGGGAHLSIDALGSGVTCRNSISCLRKRGRHVQVGLLPPDERDCEIPMSQVVVKELRICGSFGMPAHHADAIMEMICAGKLAPSRLIGNRISLEEAPEALMSMSSFSPTGISIINRFEGES
jgi:alcohol dehydrogenase